MELEITATGNEINFAPATLEEEIIQNVRTIFTTMKYSVPLDRLLGLSATMLDAPMPRARALLQAEIITAIHKNEPRCRVTKVSFEADIDGILAPTVRIILRRQQR